jgi:hypothetical protein
MRTSDAEAVIMAKVERFWQDRAIDMFREMTRSNKATTTVSGLRIAKGWPARGSITFTRDADAKKVRLYLTKKGFRGVAK